VPLEGVVNALRRIHAALTAGGLVIDTQPLSPHPTVDGAAGRLGFLDMREWSEIIGAVDERVEQTIDAGLFANEGEDRFIVIDTFDGGGTLAADVVANWKGTRIPDDLSRRLAAEHGPVRVHQEVRLRLLRAL
jgi:hypothetical protein